MSIFIDIINPSSMTRSVANWGPALNTYIIVFLIIGAGFGLVSFPNRHLFSEGPTQTAESAEPGSAGSRIVWALVCTFLWPLLLLAGLNSARILARRRREQSAPSR